MKKLSVVLAMILVVALAVPTFANPFTDVPADHWAYNAVSQLVAAGIAEGYPDGTYKGKNFMSRYEMAMFVARLLDTLEAERTAMNADINAAQDAADAAAAAAAEAAAEEAPVEDTLSKAEAIDVTAIVKALIEKNQPEVVELPEGLTDKQAADAADLVEALTYEFKSELQALGAKTDYLKTVIVAGDTELDARIAALEEAAANPVVSFSGEFGVEYSRTEVTGNGLEAEESETYFYTDPFSTNSGWYVEDADADTDNDDGSLDYRLTDGEDYFEASDPELVNTLDLNVAVRKGILSADLDMTAFANYFGDTDDDVVNYELDSLTGTITNGEFTATIGDDQSVSFKDYLFDDTTVDGVVVNIGDDLYFLSNTVETVEKSVYDLTQEAGYVAPSGYVWAPTAGDDDEVASYDRNYLRAGAKRSVDFFLPFNVYVGYEYSDAGTFDFVDDDDNVFRADVVDEVRTGMVAFDTAFDMGGIDFTTDLGFNWIGDATAGHLFRLGAASELAMFDVAFNYENTADMEFIEDDAGNTVGYDLTVGTTVGVVDGSIAYSDYDDAWENTLNLTVPAGKVSFGGIAVDGSYELTTAEDEGKNEVRAINASTDLAGFALTYAYDYDVDNELYDAEEDMVDDGVDTAADYEEADDDVNTHTFGATYPINDTLTAGAEVEFDKAVASDDNAIVFADEFVNTNTFTLDYASAPWTAGLEYVLDGDTTLTGRYTAAMFEAGFEKVLEDDLTLDAKVTAPELVFAGVTLNSSAAVVYNMPETGDALSNLEVAVDAKKAVSERLAMTAGFGWADKAYDVDFEGVKTSYGLGAEYKITEDVSATANYDFFNFKADAGEEYTATEAGAGVSLAF